MFHLVNKLRKAKARRAEAERECAVATLQAAISRKDTRAQHVAYPAAVAATNAALRLEIGR